jgi:hypothetical protein
MPKIHIKRCLFPPALFTRFPSLQVIFEPRIVDFDGKLQSMHRQNLDVTDEIADVYPTDRFVSCSSHPFIPFVLGTSGLKIRIAKWRFSIPSPPQTQAMVISTQHLVPPEGAKSKASTAAPDPVPQPAGE